MNKITHYLWCSVSYLIYSIHPQYNLYNLCFDTKRVTRIWIHFNSLRYLLWPPDGSSTSFTEDLNAERWTAFLLEFSKAALCFFLDILRNVWNIRYICFLDHRITDCVVYYRNVHLNGFLCCSLFLRHNGIFWHTFISLWDFMLFITTEHVTCVHMQYGHSFEVRKCYWHYTKWFQASWVGKMQSNGSLERKKKYIWTWHKVFLTVFWHLLYILNRLCVPYIGVTEGGCALILTTKCHCSLITVEQSEVGLFRESGLIRKTWWTSHSYMKRSGAIESIPTLTITVI